MDLYDVISNAMTSGIEKRNNLVEEVVRDVLTQLIKELLNHASYGITHLVTKFQTKNLDKIDDLTCSIKNIVIQEIVSGIRNLGLNRFDKSLVYISKRKKTSKARTTIHVHLRWKANAVKKQTESNMMCKCPICLETKSAVCLNPCGHLVCSDCNDFMLKPCPICRTLITRCHPIYQA